MSLTPEFDFSPLHGLALLLPLLVARLGIMRLLRPSALRHASFTPPVESNARWAMPVYMISEALLLLYPFFLTVKGITWIALGLPFMLAGLVLVALSAYEFTRSDGPFVGGIYRYSRNPMYVGYFLYFTGVGLATASWLYILIAFVEQVGLYWLIRGEERWCEAEYGEPYRRYYAQVRRYAGRRAPERS